MSSRARIALLVLGAALCAAAGFAACGGAAPVGESPGGVRRERTDAGAGEEPSLPDAGEQSSGW
ncbi:MAG: hypothetical protein WKG00_27025 [Polyangiaceae bacterium]